MKRKPRDHRLVRRVVKEAEEPPPDYYLRSLRSAFDPEDVLERIQTECACCMDKPEGKQAFVAWIKENANLLPDVARALDVVGENSWWCTDSIEDMEAFFEKLGFPQTDRECPRCGGTGEEPGAPLEADGRIAVCDRCHGSGERLTHCVCDNTHRQNDTVCRWCRARGRRHPNDPLP